MRTLPAIVEGRRGIITQFFQDHHEKEWYIQAHEYLKGRRTFIQKRFIDCTRYIEVHSENAHTFSYEFASILRDCGSVFSSVLDAMIKGSSPTGKKQTTIGDYRLFLKAQDDDIHLHSAHFRSRFPYGLILPFYALKTSTTLPQWWLAYNKVKHSEYKEYHFGNLGNTVTALAALVILETIFGNPSSDEIWVNAGAQYEEESFDMQTMKRLFPESE